MHFIASTKEEEIMMLRAIGVSDFSDLVATIPDKILLQDDLGIGVALSELEISDNIKYLEELNMFGTDDIIPNLTIILDIDPVQAEERIHGSTHDRMENSGNDFFKRVREGYYNIARDHSQRCVIIDGNKPADIVFEDVYEEINKKIFKELICS